MSEKDMQILRTFCILVPLLTEAGKDNLLSYGEGMVSALRQVRQTTEAPQQCAAGANEGAAGRFQQTNLFAG